jgi:hypothetical protein
MRRGVGGRPAPSSSCPPRPKEAIRAVVERAGLGPLAAGDVAAILRAAGIPQANGGTVALDDAVAAPPNGSAIRW